MYSIQPENPPLILCDLELHVLSWSDAAQRALDFDGRTAAGRSVLQLLALDDSAHFLGALRSAQAGHAAEAEAQIRGSAGALASFRISATPLSAAGTPHAIVLTFGEPQREHAGLDSLHRIAPAVAHELNNVLTVVRTYAYFARQATSRDLPARDLRVVAAAAERGAALTDWLGSKTESAPRANDELSAEAFLGAVAAQLQLLTHEGTTIETVPAAEDVLFRANSLRLEHVVLSLVLNANQTFVDCAFTFAFERRRLLSPDLADAGPDGYAVLAVGCRSTAGPRSSTSDDEPGAGAVAGPLAPLGELLQSMGGALKVVCCGPSHTRFELLLPALKQGTAPAEARPRLKLAPQPSTGLVLVVEDEAAIRLAIKRTLTKVGYSVVEACDGVAARELLLQHGTAVSLVISDAVLPKGSGPELAVWARATCPNAGFLLVSGRQHEGEAEARSVGAQFLAKPFYPAELLAAVRRVFSSARVAARVKGASSEQRVVLVVDDETDILDSFERLLRECEFETLVSKSGLHALQILDQRHIDAVIADQFMPGLDGIGLLEVVHQRFPGTTRILCTGHPASDIALTAVKRGRVHRVLAKTMHAVALRDEIERAVLDASSQD